MRCLREVVIFNGPWTQVTYIFNFLCTKLINDQQPASLSAFDDIDDFVNGAVYEYEKKTKRKGVAKGKSSTKAFKSKVKKYLGLLPDSEFYRTIDFDTISRISTESR
jgi:hypothetical protein